MWSLTLLLGLVLLCLAAALGIQTVGPSEYRRRLRSYLGIYNVPENVTFTGTVALSNMITNVTNLSNLRVGQSLTGNGIPPGTTITVVGTGGVNTITISQAATVAGSLVPLVASGPTASPLIHLAAAVISPGGDPVPSSFTEATFDTYAALPLVGTAVYSNPDGSAESDFGPCSWVLLAAPVTGNTIYGYWIDYIDPLDGVTRVVSCWESFPTPIPMNAAGNAVVVTPPANMPLPGSAVVP